MTVPKLSVVITTLAILSVTLAASVISERRRPDTLAQPLKDIPLSLAGWSYAGDSPLPENALKRLVPTDYISRVYVKKGQQLGLLVVYYAEQRSGESMHSPKHCLPGSGWGIWNYSVAKVPVNGHDVLINDDSIENAGARDIILYWYQSRDNIIASELLGKLLLVRDALFNGHTAGAIVRVLLPDRPESRSEGVAFAQALIPQVQRSFGTR